MKKRTRDTAERSGKAAELAALLDRGDAAAVEQFFAPLTEKERKALAGIARDHLAGLFEGIGLIPEVASLVLRTSSGSSGSGFGVKSAKRRQLEAVRLALFATGTLSELRRYGLPPESDADQVLNVLIARRPPWLDRWAVHLLQQREERRVFQHSYFPAVRRLVREGLIAEPDVPDYVWHMIQTPGPVMDLLRDDPELLEATIWRLFEPNPMIQGALASHGHLMGEETYLWDWTLAQLAVAGRLPRARLIDAMLGTLESGLTAHQARWYLRLHERLQPTPEELTERGDRYFGLLHSSVPQVVGCALDALGLLDQTEPLPLERLATGLAPALPVMDRKRVRAALDLLARAADRDPAGRSGAARAACLALGHPTAEVQKLAWDFVEKVGATGDTELVTLVEGYSGLVAATLQGRLRDWLESAGVAKPQAATPAAPTFNAGELRERATALDPALRRIARVDDALAALERGVIDLVPLTFDGTDIPRLDPDHAVTPVKDLDELIELVGRLLHKAEDADDFERALDGISRLCDQRPDDFDARTAPLQRRAMKDDAETYGGEVGDGLLPELAYLVYEWLPLPPSRAAQTFLQKERLKGSRPSPAKVARERSGLTALLGFLGHRRRELAARVAAGIAAPLLSAPTHRGGWIDSRVLVARLAKYLERGLPVGEYDGVAALLRLAPDHRAAALKQAKSLPAAADPKQPFATEFPQALRYALGDEGQVGPTPSLWIAAARSRAPWADDPRVEAAHPRLGPDAGRRATSAARIVEIQSQYDNPLVEAVTPRVPDAPPYTHPTVMFHRAEEYLAGFGGGWSGEIPWLFTLWPSAREVLFLKGAQWLACHQNGVYIDSERRRFLEPLLDPDVPLLPHATLLLALGLTAKDGSISGLAVDALIAAIEDGRLDPPRLGGEMAKLGAVKVGKFSRWATNLATAARVAPLHAEAVRQTVQHALHGDPAAVAREVGPLVDLLLELCSQCGRGVTEEATRSFLTGLSGKAGKTARRILDLKTDDNPTHAPAIHLTVVEHRLTRTERWRCRRES